MDCYKDFIGIRHRRDDQQPTDKPSKSGLYIEDLAGFSLQRVAGYADYESGYDLVTRKALWACQLVTDDVLNNIGYLQTNNLINLRVASPYTDYFNDYFAGERGFRVRKYFSERQTLSTFRITKIYIKSNDTVEGKIVKLIDGDNVIEFTVDLVAGETTVIYPTDVVKHEDYIVKSNEFSIVMDNTDVRTFQSQTVIQDCGCNSSKWTPNTDRNFYVSGEEFGITCDFSYFCNLDSLRCLLLQQFRYSILYKTGMIVLDECLATNRLNYFAVNSKEWAEKQKTDLETLYNENVRQNMRNLVNVIRSVDSNCFECRKLSQAELIM